MSSFGRYDYSADAVTQSMCVSIKMQRPSGYFRRAFIRDRYFTVSYHHDVFVRKIKVQGLVIIHCMMCQMVCQYTSLDCFLSRPQSCPQTGSLPVDYLPAKRQIPSIVIVVHHPQQKQRNCGFLQQSRIHIVSHTLQTVVRDLFSRTQIITPAFHAHTS